MRINEVAISNWSNIRKHKDSWWFFIKGKGDKPGHIPINDQLLEFIKTYRLYLGKQALPEVYETEALLISKKTKQPLRVRQLYTLVKSIGGQAAERFAVKNKQKKLKAMSPHWLRHLSASHQDRAGIPVTVIQANHRHGSSATTQIYVHAEDLRRAQEINKLQIELKPVLLTPKQQEEELELKIILTRGPLDKIAGLKQFINALEEFILPSGWQRLEYFTDHDVKRAFTMGRAVVISYKILKTDEQDLIVAAVKREAVIRLFECEVRSKKCIEITKI